MSEFLAVEPNYRMVPTDYGDRLQTVAARELGDANRWPELVWLNRLVPPYITDDPDAVVPGVVLSGSLLRVPAPAGFSTVGADAGQVLERDCALKNKRLMLSDSGDLAVFTGVDNFKQQISHRIVTPRGEAIRHPEYGCMVWRLLGVKNGPATTTLGTQYLRSALASEYRVASVGSVTAEVVGDTVKMTAKIQAIAGGYVDLLVDTSARAT